VNDPEVLRVNAARRLKGFDLSVEFTSNVENTVVFGPSGGGKSMTLRAIAGALRLDGGRIVIRGSVLYDSSRKVNVPAHSRNVGYVPQGYGLFPHLTVAQNIAYGIRQRDRGARGEVLKRMVALTELAGLEKRRPAELSGGQQQRVALARALAAEPSVLLLDEPFSALDSAMRRTLRAEVLEVQARTHVPVVTVTHDLQDAFELGDRIVVIDGGKVLQQGGREDVFYRPASRRVAELVGSRNLLEAQVVSVEDGRVACSWAGNTVVVQGHSAVSVGQAVTLCIRSTQVMIRRPEGSYEGRPNVLSGTIVSEIVTPEGYRLVFQVAGQPGTALQIELPGYVYFRLGLDAAKDIDVSIRPDALHLIPEIES